MTLDSSLKDRRVLVVEDEYLVAEAMGRSLRRAGAVVLGPVPSVSEAMALLDREEDIDGAVLDINLGEHKVYPLADLLLARGTRCVFATGNDASDVPSGYAHVIRCEKPVSQFCIVDALSTSVAGHGPAAASTSSFLPALRLQVSEQVEAACGAGHTLVAAKLSEALDAIDEALDG